jgi:hypothetical protein
MMMYSTLAEFHNYVFKFYGRGGVYPMGAKLKDIVTATAILIDELDATDSEFHGDSMDRELVRDILIREYGLQFPD